IVFGGLFLYQKYSDIFGECLTKHKKFVALMHFSDRRFVCSLAYFLFAFPVHARNCYQIIYHLLNVSA
ncbi:MAG: hypothetical protein KAQ68_08280, partial [Clostridiales bacterium]|nr:hypothetical protein [Clostridiales bacterium]